MDGVLDFFHYLQILFYLLIKAVAVGFFFWVIVQPVRIILSGRKVFNSKKTAGPYPGPGYALVEAYGEAKWVKVEFPEDPPHQLPPAPAMTDAEFWRRWDEAHPKVKLPGDRP